MTGNFTTIIQREDDGYMAHCPELDIASQGDTIKEARHNLREALELFFEAASQKEIQDRLKINTLPVILRERSDRRIST